MRCSIGYKMTETASPLVSVIMPVYNVKDYLCEAIRSVVDQTLCNWELICIDDGSSDESPAILDEWQTKDPRIKVFHVPNAGLGAARNMGVRLSRGKYIYFLDSDDLIEDIMLDRVVDKLDSNDLDVVMFGAKVIVEDNANHDVNQYVRSNNYSGIWSGADLYVKQVSSGDYYSQACLYAMRAGFIKKMGFVFPEGIIHEDELFTFEILFNASKVMVLPDLLYIRRYRPNSIMTSRDWDKSLRGYLRTIDGVESQEPMTESQNRALAVAKTKLLNLAFQAYINSDMSVSELVALAKSESLSITAGTNRLLEYVHAKRHYIRIYRACHNCKLLLTIKRRLKTTIQSHSCY